MLGGGHRRFYPARHRELAAAMVAGGGAVLSPFAPDEPARPPQFLQRNGVVTALADAVVIVEAAARSGALNTASWAAQLGIAVLAFPGDVERPKAAGCNALIRDGATLVRDAADVFEALGLEPAGLPAALPLPFRADPLERAVLALLDQGPADFEALSHDTQTAPGRLLSTLVRLEIEGVVERDATGYARAAYASGTHPG